ncbi:TetR/AcrR family transcriptional regulator [Amycolatopsis sp. NPDC005232]|uniref:TetR/AcrR family transcriptional regulator n=1 Tax=Amycolatopsis sp. NPDC005232 TaxID=3157027 RepID=UPI0033B0E38B
MNTKRQGRSGRREAVVTAAMDLFSRKRYDDVYISEIAETAGVAHGLLFYHFKDKRGLYLEVLRRMLDELVDLQRRREDELTGQQWLRGVTLRQVEYRREHAQTMLVMMRPGGHDEDVDAVVEQSRRAGVRFLADLVGLTGELPPRVRITMRAAMGAADGMITDWLTHGCDLEVTELIEAVYVVVVAALGTVCEHELDLKTVVGGPPARRT